jgi:hypothetical protein
MARVATFLQGLGELGWAVGRNVRIDYRWSAGDPDRTRKNATELIALAPDVILATGSPVTAALLQATRTVPIVFAQVPDPVANGFVASLASWTGSPPVKNDRNRGGRRLGRQCRRKSVDGGNHIPVKSSAQIWRYVERRQDHRPRMTSNLRYPQTRAWLRPSARGT